MCGDAISAPWASPGFGSGTSGPAAARRGGVRSRRRLELAFGSVLALALLAFVPIHYGAPSAGADEPHSGLAAASTAQPNQSGVNLVGTLRLEIVGAEPGQLAADTQVNLPADGQVSPSTAAGSDEASGSNGVAADATTAPGSPASDRPPNTAQPKPLAKPAVVSAPAPAPAPQPLAEPGLYKKDLYDGSMVRYQDPDMTACTATATLMMLNFTATRGSVDSGFVWSPTTAYSVQESILGWERQNDTLVASAPGSDPHGWRNALNYYGWSDFQNSGTHHYEDLSYSSFASAVKAAVVAIATENQPVGILGWSGGHAQIMTGYEVSGADPAVSSDFTVEAVYLTDPLASDKIRDARITYLSLGGGPSTYRFTPYTWRDSPDDDPYMPGTTASYLEWYGKWVIVAPVSMRSAIPAAPAS
jgi:hypothetical protein